MSGTMRERLHTFASAILERRGALVDWPAAEATGTAMLPPEAAAAVGAAGDVVALGGEASAAGLSVSSRG
jgi:hypothetical protein